MQRTQVQSLVRGDSTCCRATKTAHHNYWACALELGEATTEPTHRSHWSLCTAGLRPKGEAPQGEDRALQQRRPCSPQLCYLHTAIQAQHSQQSQQVNKVLKVKKNIEVKKLVECFRFREPRSQNILSNHNIYWNLLSKQLEQVEKVRALNLIYVLQELPLI